MKEKLNNVYSLLSDIEVHGKKNLNNLLAAIQIVEQMYDSLDELGQSKGDKNEVQ